MPTEMKTAGNVDFDDVFDPYVQGAKPAATGYKTSDDVDLNQRYAPLEYGAQAPATGCELSNGADLNTLWAAKGSAIYTIPGLSGKLFYAHDQALTSQSQVSATVSFGINNDGTWACYGGTSRGPTNWSPETGTWLPAGANASDYEVQFVISATGVPPATLSNGASSYVNCGTSRSLMLQLPTGGGTSAVRQANASVTVRLRRIGGPVSETSFNIEVITEGFQ